MRNWYVPFFACAYLNELVAQTNINEHVVQANPKQISRGDPTNLPLFDATLLQSLQMPAATLRTDEKKESTSVASTETETTTKSASSETTTSTSTRYAHAKRHQFLSLILLISSQFSSSLIHSP